MKKVIYMWRAWWCRLKLNSKNVSPLEELKLINRFLNKYYFRITKIYTKKWKLTAIEEKLSQWRSKWLRHVLHMSKEEQCLKRKRREKCWVERKIVCCGGCLDSSCLQIAPPLQFTYVWNLSLKNIGGKIIISNQLLKWWTDCMSGSAYQKLTTSKHRATNPVTTRVMKTNK